MARLSKEEQEQLDALTKKRDSPDTDRGERVNFTVDFSDAAAVKRAVRAGYLPESALDEIEDDDDDDDKGKDKDKDKDKDRPNRRRQSGDKKDAAPRRRLTGADNWAGS